MRNIEHETLQKDIEDEIHLITPDVDLDELIVTSRALHDKAIEAFLSSRERCDNLTVHEPWVAKNFIRIGRESSADGPHGRPLTTFDFKVGLGVSFLHDGFAVDRSRIHEAATGGASNAVAVALQTLARIQMRQCHMVEGAKVARKILEQLKRPDSDELLFTPVETDWVVGMISMHDAVKTGLPWPPSYDWLAVCFFDADMLWPLQRPDADLARLVPEGALAEFSDEVIRDQAAKNLEHVLRKYQATFVGIDRQVEQSDVVIRTSEGRRAAGELLNRYRL